MSSSELARLRKTVRTYHLRHGRHDLPWRKTHDPYRILVSETMLQQTQVQRVIAYYRRFLAVYPTARALADAPLGDVLKLWSGLGYNRRAKYLHEAARGMQAFKKGHRLAYKDLRTLPGVGDYTAKAVRVFAFNEPEVLIETNIRAVFIHHFFPRARAVPDAKLLPLIEAALRRQDPRTWYAALMDYGSFLKVKYPNPSRKSKHHAKQSKFEGSLRQVRGAILKACTKGESLERVRTQFPDQFERAYTALCTEGLIA